MSYQKQVLTELDKAQAAGGLQPGQVYIVSVRHDDWCAVLKGTGPCDCNPDVRPPERVPQGEEN